MTRRQKHRKSWRYTLKQYDAELTALLILGGFVLFLIPHIIILAIQTN